MATTIEHWIGGSATAGASTRRGAVYNPATGAVQAEVLLAEVSDVDAAVAAAKEAFGEWSQASLSKRTKTLFAFRELVNANIGPLAEIVSYGMSADRYASLHTVPDNPLQDLLQRPRDAWLFALVVFVAGGFREEIQRAFLLHRFDVWLGGPVVGLVVTSAGFGAGHLFQGVDAAITTGLLGAFWAAVYLRRRSAAAPIVSHAGFDLVQIVPYMLGRSVG